MIIIERKFQIWKDGKYTERDVSILFVQGSGTALEKIKRLKDDYPESEGYFLKDQGRLLHID